MALIVKNPPAKAGDIRDSGSIPGLGRYPGGGNGNPLQYSCLENPMGRGAWQVIVHRVAKCRTRLNTETHTSAFPGSSAGKEPACNAGDPGSIPGSGRSPGEGTGYPFQYSRASLVVSWRRISLQCGRPGFDPWVGKIPWRRERLLIPVFWPGECHGLYTPWVLKELDMTERLALSLSSTVLSTQRSGGRSGKPPQ